MNFDRYTLINIYSDIRNYLTGVSQFNEEYTIACVKAHIEIHNNQFAHLSKIAKDSDGQSDDTKGFISSILSNLVTDVETDKKDKKKKRGRPKKSEVEVA
tara:strand:- start:315 stop:614 length:300 start_codon:yes stop_codon:yes gene_type:complete